MIADARQPTVKGSPRSYHTAMSCYEAINPFSSAEMRNEKGESSFCNVAHGWERTDRYVPEKNSRMPFALEIDNRFNPLVREFKIHFFSFFCATRLRYIRVESIFKLIAFYARGICIPRLRTEQSDRNSTNWKSRSSFITKNRYGEGKIDKDEQGSWCSRDETINLAKPVGSAFLLRLTASYKARSKPFIKRAFLISLSLISLRRSLKSNHNTDPLIFPLFAIRELRAIYDRR